MSSNKLIVGVNDLEIFCKQNDKEYLLEEWDYEKNAPLTPKDIAYGSGKEIWWVCNKGHSFSQSPDKRKSGVRCPFCSGKRVLKGFNDLETWCKQNSMEYLLQEWDYSKNKLKPDEVTPFSSKKVSWKCKYGHEWDATINNRSKGTRCPKCGLQSTSFSEQAILFYIKQHFPDVVHRCTDFGFEIDVYIPSIKTAIEYDGVAYHKSRPKTELSKNQKCKKNNITLIRIREQGLCPYDDCVCIYREDTNTKKGLDTALIKLFNYLDINTINIDTDKDALSILEQYKFIEIKNSIATTHPELAKEWHPTKNGNLKPEQFSAGSSEKIWWQCEHDHEWQVRISARTITGNNCPICANQQVLKGYNDFETWCKNNDKEDLLSEWDYKKNDILPSEIMPHIAKKVWWKCDKGHEWQAQINSRTKGCGCPVCSNQTLLVGFNDLDTYCKENNLHYLLDEWDYDKNFPLTTKDVVYGTARKVWWKCDKGHEWQASINSRVKGYGCKKCNNHSRKVRCIETGEIFDSVTLAAEFCGIKMCGIVTCCKTKKTAGGYHWEYVDDNEDNNQT